MSRGQILRRRAAARVFYGGFHALAVIPATFVYFPHQVWGDDLFTDDERAYLERVKRRINADADLLRKFAHRLEST